MKKAWLVLFFGILNACSLFQEPKATRSANQNVIPIFEKPELPPNFKLEPTFESIKVGFIEQKCLYCHQPGHKAERVPMSTREDLIDSPLEIVIPGNSEESGILLVIAADARKPMPPKNSGAPAVTAEDIAILKQWIDQGAP